MKRLLPWLLLALSVAACHAQPKGDADDAALKPVNVSVASVRQGTVSEVVAGFGSLVVPPDQVANVASATGGRVLRVLAKVGDHVAQGQVLVELQGDPTSTADLAKARIVAAQTKRDRDREKALVAAGVEAPMLYQQAESAYESAAADLQLKEKSAELAGRNTVLRAPRAGVVTDAPASVGMVAAPQATLMSLANLSTLWADIALSPDTLSRVHPGMSASVELGDHSKVSGRVVAINRVLASDTQQGGVRIALMGTLPQAQPGEFARGAITIGEQKGLVIPATALLTRDDGTAVYTVENGKAKLRPVKAGEASSGQVLVTSGLKPGDQVVTAGAYELTDGNDVRPTGARP